MVQLFFGASCACQSPRIGFQKHNRVIYLSGRKRRESNKNQKNIRREKTPIVSEIHRPSGR